MALMLFFYYYSAQTENLSKTYYMNTKLPKRQKKKKNTIGDFKTDSCVLVFCKLCQVSAKDV